MQQYWARGTPYKFVPVNTFAEAFQKWDLGRELTAAAAAPYDKAAGHQSALVRTQYALRSWDMFKATMKREWTLMVRNRFLYIFRTFQVSDSGDVLHLAFEILGFQGVLVGGRFACCRS